MFSPTCIQVQVSTILPFPMKRHLGFPLKILCPEPISLESRQPCGKPIHIPVRGAIPRLRRMAGNVVDKLLHSVPCHLPGDATDCDFASRTLLEVLLHCHPPTSAKKEDLRQWSLEIRILHSRTLLLSGHRNFDAFAERIEAGNVRIADRF